MTVLRDVNYELLGRIVTGLRANEVLMARLYSLKPSVDPQRDKRIYASDEDIPVKPVNVREVLPRVLVDVLEDPFETEQDTSATPLARATVFVHVLVEAYQRDVGEEINGLIRVILGSTQWSDSNIMAAALVPVGVLRPVREKAFRDAWRFTREYRSGLVGVNANA